MTALERMRGAIEGGYGELAAVDAARQVRTMKALKGRSEDKVDELAAKEEQIQQLQQQLAVRIDNNMTIPYSRKYRGVHKILVRTWGARPGIYTH